METEPDFFFANLPHTSPWNLDAQVSHSLSLLASGHSNRAMAMALRVAKNFPDRAEGQALCGHILTTRKLFSAALEYFARAIDQNPLDNTWLCRAVKTALAADQCDLAASWLSGLEKQYAPPPPLEALFLARDLGLNLTGAVGIHHGEVFGWAFLEHGRKPIVRAQGEDALRLRISPLKQQADATLWRIHIPLNPSAPLTMHFLDPQGRHLGGSPLYCEPVSLVADYFQQKDQARPVRAGSLSSASRRKSSTPDVTVIVPVYDDPEASLLCLKALEESRAFCETSFETLVIWDAGPDADLLAVLKDKATRGEIRLIMNPWNMGFVNSVNRALRQALGRDAALLNADALVCTDWLDRLRRRARSLSDVGTVTPLTNYGELVSYPHPQSPGSIDTLEQVRLLDQACATVNAANPSQTPDLPVGVGFCMYIRAKLLRAVGGLDSTQIHRGYGEEVDFCLRGAARGYRNCVAPDVFVGHLGGRSFGADKRRLALQNNKALYARYPHYRKDYLDFLRRDPLQPYRERVSRHLLNKLDGPLWIVDKACVDQPLLWAQERDQQAAGQPWALALAEPRGELVRLTLIIKNTAVPHADIHLALPEEADSFHEMLARLDPDRIEVLGPGRGARSVAVGLHGKTRLLLTRLPRVLLENWKKGEDPDPLCLKGFEEISCAHAGLGRWLQPTYRVQIHQDAMVDDPPSLDIAGLDARTTPSLLACGLHSAAGWARLAVLARELHGKDITLWAAGLKTWEPIPFPPGIHPAPLALDDPAAIWHHAGVQSILCLEDDPSSHPHWRTWAEERGLDFFIPDDPLFTATARLVV